MLYIEKINDELSKAYIMTKYKNNYSKDFLFDVFSNFCLIKKKMVLISNEKIIILIFLLFSKLAFSIDIDDAIKSTIENNPKVKIAYEKLTESKELIENAYNQKLPTITSTISGTYSTSDSTTSNSNNNT